MFVTLDSGKAIPVEPIPHLGRGTVAATRGRDGKLRGHVMSRDKPEQPGQSRYVVHRAACKPDKPKVSASQRALSLFDP